MGQQLQDANVLSRAGGLAQPSFERLTQATEAGGQLPVAVDGSMIEGGGLGVQNAEKMQRIEHLLATAVAAWMARDDLAVGDQDDAIDVAFDRDDAKGPTSGNAVTVVVEADRLILVDLGRLHDAGVEGTLGDRQRGRSIVLEADADGVPLVTAGPFASDSAAVEQVPVQCVEVGDLRHGRGPLSLQVVDAVLHSRLLGGGRGHAELGSEGIVRRQSGISRMQGAFASLEDVQSNGRGIVPPQLGGDAVEEAERLDKSVQDGFGPFGGQGDGEGSVGVTPSHQEHGDLASAIGEVDVNVSEVGFGPYAGSMIERNEGGPLVSASLLDMTSDLIVATAIAMLGDEPAIDLHGGVSLFARGVLVGIEDVIDETAEGPEDGCVARLGRLRDRLGLSESFEDGLGRVMKFLGDLSDGSLIATELPDLGMLIHREHPCLPCGSVIATRKGCATAFPF